MGSRTAITQPASQTGRFGSVGFVALRPQSTAVGGLRQLIGTRQCFFRNWMGILETRAASMSFNGSLGQ